MLCGQVLLLVGSKGCSKCQQRKKLKRKNDKRMQGKTKPNVEVRKKIRKEDDTRRSRERARRRLINSRNEGSKIEGNSDIRKRRGAVGDSAAVVMMRSNKRFKPGD